MTVNNFVFLAKHHFFDCIIFHRVIPAFMDQTGDPTGTGTGGPGYQFADELPEDGYSPVPAGVGGHGQLAAPTPTAASSSSWPAREGESPGPELHAVRPGHLGMAVVEKINADGEPASGTAPAHRSLAPHGRRSTVTVAVVVPTAARHHPDRTAPSPPPRPRRPP